ncbi:hypothetical protein LTR95_012499 [Oleoguttula sp. CCFEE 5521]
MSSVPRYAVFLLAFGCAPVIRAHSYVVELRQVRNGDLLEGRGYSRGYGVNKSPLVIILPPAPNPFVSVTDLMCKTTQTVNNQTGAWPSLEVHPGDRVALRYRENGDISVPTPNKLTFGTLSVYGTANPIEGEVLSGVHHVWNRNATGGDRRGRLLARQSFDDGSCYTDDNSILSTSRAALGQPPHDDLDGQQLACRIEVDVPGDVPSASTYSLYWVWDWPTYSAVGPGKVKDEMYTTCIDLYIA